METSDWIAIAALASSVFLWWIERRSRKAQVEDEAARGEEQLRLFRLQVEADLEDRAIQREKERAAAAEAKAISRAHIRGGALNVVHELRTNADVAKRCEEGYHVAAEAQQLNLVQWKNFRSQIAELKGEARELWQELEETYEALELSKARGARPPSSAYLRELADRLAKAAEG